MSTANEYLIELLTRTQRQWLISMDGPDDQRTERNLRAGLVVSQFSAAWFLSKLIELDPAVAQDATTHLKAILADGGEIGAFTWDMLSARGIDPSTIAPAPTKETSR